MARVDLIVPTYNGTAYLLECLHSLRSSTFTDFTLLVFDDGSTEPVDQLVHSIYPDATVLRARQNIGLTRAFNAAIDATSAEYVVLLNNDTEVTPRWLQHLVECADRHPRAGSVSSKLRLASDRHVIHSTGDTYSVWGMPGNRGVWLEDFGQYDREEEVFSACAGAALYRRTALDDIRLLNGDVFDTRLFMYCEDVELGWRLQRAGHICLFAPDALVFHHLSATGGGMLASYYVSRNLWVVLAVGVPNSIRKQYWPRITAHHLGRNLRALGACREPAARKSLAGTVRGIALFLRLRNRERQPESEEDARILELLVER